MSQPVLTLINPSPVEPAQVVAEESTLTALEERQSLLAHHVRMLARGMSVDAVFSSMAHLGLLRSALWGDPRVVTYNSSQLDDLPGSFIFESRLVFCANLIPRRNDAFKAVLSRCDIFELNATQEEVVDLMRSIASAGYETMTPNDCLTVVDFIEKNGDDRAISLRLLEPSFRKVMYARSEGLDWRPLVMTQLKTLGRKEDTSRRIDTRANEVRLLHQAIEQFPRSVTDQQAFWSRATGKSRASFFRLLARHRPR